MHDSVPEPDVLVETVWYTCAVQKGITGDVRQIIRHRPDEGEGETYHRAWFIGRGSSAVVQRPWFNGRG